MDIVVDRRPFPKELLLHQLDTALVACEEASFKVMDSLGGGQGQKARDLIQKCFRDRHNTAYNVNRLTAVGRKPTSEVPRSS